MTFFEQDMRAELSHTWKRALRDIPGRLCVSRDPKQLSCQLKCVSVAHATSRVVKCNKSRIRFIFLIFIPTECLKTFICILMFVLGISRSRFQCFLESYYLSGLFWKNIQCEDVILTR